MNNGKVYSVVIDEELIRCDMEGCGEFHKGSCNYEITGMKATCGKGDWFRISQSPLGQPGPVVLKFQSKGKF